MPVGSHQSSPAIHFVMSLYVAHRFFPRGGAGAFRPPPWRVLFLRSTSWLAVVCAPPGSILSAPPSTAPNPDVLFACMPGPLPPLHHCPLSAFWRWEGSFPQVRES